MTNDELYLVFTLCPMLNLELLVVTSVIHNITLTIIND